MSQTATKAAPRAVLPQLSDEQKALIKRTICKGASDDDLALFFSYCNRTGLDPFAKQIFAVFRKDKSLGRKVMTIQTSIDGFRLIGERTGKADGQDGPYWCGQDGVWKDVWVEKTPPVAAKISVYRKGSSRPWTGVAHWREYASMDSPFWKDMPANQLAKCAEALALRKAFPQELSGLYASEEIGEEEDAPLVSPPVQAQQAALSAPQPAPSQTAPPLPLSVSPLTEAQFAQIKALKDELSLSGEPWQNFLRPFGKKPSEASEQEAGEMIRKLQLLRDAQAQTPVGPDGLAILPPPARNGTGGVPAAAGFRPDASVPF